MDRIDRMAIYLWMAIPVLLVPVIMRFILTRGLILLARRRLLPGQLKQMEKGWDSGAGEIFIAAESTIRRRLNSLLPPAYEFTSDIQEILLAVQQKRNPSGKTEEDLRFTFSIRDAAEVGLLAFTDIYTDIQRRPLLRRLFKLKIRWLVWVRNLSRGYSRLMNLKPIRTLVHSRVLGLLFRLLLSPLIGLPMLLFYLIRSFTTGLLSDGLFRYLYALVLLRITYYGIYLYGGENPLIKERIAALRKSDILDAGKQLESLLDPAGWEAASSHAAEAAKRLNAFFRDMDMAEDHRLEALGSDPDSPSRKPGASFLRGLKRLRGSAVLTVRRQLGTARKETGIVQGILQLFSVSSEEYLPDGAAAVDSLRVGELVALGYFSSLHILSRLYSAPGIRSTLGRIPVDLAIRINTLSEDELVQQLFSGARKGLRAAGIAQKLRRTSRMFRGRYHPAGFAVSFAPPFALAHIETSIKTGLYHAAGRLFLYVWEKNSLAASPEIDKCLIIPFRSE